jgi:hypothetical protein
VSDWNLSGYLDCTNAATAFNLSGFIWADRRSPFRAAIVWAQRSLLRTSSATVMKPPNPALRQPVERIILADCHLRFTVERGDVR